MRDRHAPALARFFADLDDAEAERFIDQLTALVEYLRDTPAPMSKTSD